MRKSIYVMIPFALALLVLVSGCGKQKLLKEHTSTDQTDGPILAELNTELQNTAIYNDSVIQYYNLLNQTNDPQLEAYYEGQLQQFDNRFHESENNCIDLQNQMDDIHHCGMQDQCDNMMNSHGMWGHNNNGNNDKYADHCTLMDDINNDCGELEDVQAEHTNYCPL
jgi:hypothetical protein